MENLNKIRISIGVILIFAATPYSVAQEPAPLVNGTAIYLSPAESWTFYQGYSFTLKSVSEGGDQGWAQLKLNDTVIRTYIFSGGETLNYNATTEDSNETVLFSFYVQGIYSGEDHDIITFSPVFQYYDPNLPEPTPIPTERIDNNGNTSGIPDHDGTERTVIPGFWCIQTAIIICLCSILIRRVS